MKDDQLQRGKEIEKEIEDLVEQKSRIKQSIDYYKPKKEGQEDVGGGGSERKLYALIHYGWNGSHRINMTRPELVNGLNLILMRVEKEIADLEQEFKEL